MSHRLKVLSIAATANFFLIIFPLTSGYLIAEKIRYCTNWIEPKSFGCPEPKDELKSFAAIAIGSLCWVVIVHDLVNRKTKL